MPSLSERAQEKLIRIYLKAETDIINEIARLRFLGLADYHVVAALRRVQGILQKMQSEAWTYTPRMIEGYFYAKHPDLRKMPTTSIQALAGYLNAVALTAEQTDIVQRLTISMMAEIEDASDTVVNTLEGYLVGRRDRDVFRAVGLSTVAEMEAEGTRRKKVDQFVKDLQRDGVTAFVDKSGRRWRLHTYAAMVTRTTSRQAEVLSVITRDPAHDLYTIIGTDDPCGLCAAFQDRVYSRSGESKEWPPLADAFGKIDLAGPNTLTNTWMNIHPNCRCAVVPWTPAGKSREEIERLQRFSNPANNPYNLDPRSEKVIKAYRRKEAGRRRWRADYDQWERYRVTIPADTPKTFATFMRHKKADDEKYKNWERKYREKNQELRQK